MKNERFIRETEEFYELYPDVDIDDIPRHVWEEVKSGRSLCEAYADFAGDLERVKKEAAEINATNGEKSTGSLLQPRTAHGTFTAAEVSKMTPEQVRENYEEIMRSIEAKGFYS